MKMNNIDLTGKRILITGGTGSLGRTLLKRLLNDQIETIKAITIFSRDETKQHMLRCEYLNSNHLIHASHAQDLQSKLHFQIGDIRNKSSLVRALQNVDIVFHAAALKQIPSCEYFPEEAIMTNIIGAQNIVEVLQEHAFDVETVVGISTDKAVLPVNVMGMTKALQERLFTSANFYVPNTKFVLARYGNVLASRGSVIPYFHDQIKNGGPVSITHEDMTRFLLSLDEAVDVILDAANSAHRGETYIPIAVAARVTDIAATLIGDRPIKTEIIGIRPGEKLHECLVSTEESLRTYQRGNYYVIAPNLPELYNQSLYQGEPLNKAYRSNDNILNITNTKALLEQHQLMIEAANNIAKDFLF